MKIILLIISVVFLSACSSSQLKNQVGEKAHRSMASVLALDECYDNPDNSTSCEGILKQESQIAQEIISQADHQEITADDYEIDYEEIASKEFKLDERKKTKVFLKK
jgi:hypothetical protein